MLAASPQAEASTIYACVKKKSGSARFVKKSAKCRKGETKISWSSQGPAGKNGAPGPAGAPGLQGGVGQTGPQGPDAQRIVADQRGVVPFATIATLGPWTVAMECEPGLARIRITGPGSYFDTATRGLKAAPAESEINSGLIEGGTVAGIGDNEQMDLHGFLIDEPNIEQFDLEVSDSKGLISSCSVTGDALAVS